MQAKAGRGMAIDGFLTRSVRDTAVMLDACEGADLGAPYWAPPLAQGHAAAISRPPRRLRVALCDTTFTGEPIHPECRRGGAGRGSPAGGRSATMSNLPCPRADVPGMMRAWTDIVAVGTALGVRRRRWRAARSPRTRSKACAAAPSPMPRPCTPTRYLEAVGEIHAFGRQMAGVLRAEDGRTTSC